jgi:hypothetical protein
MATATSSKIEYVLASLLLFVAMSHLLPAQTPLLAFDVVIANGHIIDGTGSPWYSGDIGNGPSTPKAKWSRRVSSTCSVNPR